MERMVITVSYVDEAGVTRGSRFWIEPGDVAYETRRFKDAGYDVQISTVYGPFKALAQ